jgi:peptidoglycan/xylan/chitin deacetylase (PgdA/CDA1 family)
MKLNDRLAGRARRELAKRLSRRSVPIRLESAMISFTFDDFPRSALKEGGAILRRHGSVGTYYVSLGLMDKDEAVGRMFSHSDLHDLVSEGHELGCHTFSHCDAWETSPEQFEASVLANKQALKTVLPDTQFRTLSFPINSPRPTTKKRMARHFACCRGGDQTNNVGTADLNNLKAFFLEQSLGDIGVVKRLIDQNTRERGWLIFATHDVCENPTRFGCTPSFFNMVVRYAVDSSAKLRPVCKALEEVLSHDFQSLSPS